MGYPKEVYNRAWEELSRRSQAARELTRTRREEIRRAVPEIARLEREMARTAATVARAIIADPDHAQENIARLSEQNLTMQHSRGELLMANGYPADYLAEQYGCPHCRDHGYVGAEMCGCLRRLLKREAYTQLSAVSQAGLCRFETFSLDYYPAKPVDGSGIVPRQRMAQILEVCGQYAATFSPGAQSLLLIGHTGLGKTHLSLAIAAAVTEAGYGVVYTPLQKLMDRLESNKFSRASGGEQYAENIEFVTSCDLLVLDDLGTEFHTQFTGAVLYNIINTRLVEGRPTIISTNLELSQIEEKYSQRMVSRLVCSYKVLKFYGRDIRFIQKSEQK